MLGRLGKRGVALPPIAATSRKPAAGQDTAAGTTPAAGRGIGLPLLMSVGNSCSKVTTRLRPLALASYSARSAAVNSVATSAPAPALAAPTLTVAATGQPAIVPGGASEAAATPPATC